MKVAQQDLLTGIEPVGNKVGFLVGYNMGSSVRGSVFGLGVGIGRDVGLGVGLVGKRVGARVGMAIKISIGGPNTTPVTVTSAIACRQRALQYLTLPKDAKDGQANTYATKKAYEIYDRDKLALFELKRQRIFRIFQELTAVNHENGDNNNNADSIKFYRADMRPSIPEFFDMGELPLLEGIFGSHPDITHVVHLADDDIKNQAIIPRNRDSVKAGRMEGILEELRLILERRAAAEAVTDEKDNEEEENVVAAAAYRLPQFVYASSYEVYDYL